MVGPGRTQEIYAGDSLKLQVHGKYLEDKKQKANVGSFMAAGGKQSLIADLNELAVSTQRAGGGNPIALFNLANILAADFQKKEAPEAYLMYALYDQDSNRYEVGKKVLSKNAANQHEVLEEEMYLSKDGYMETFVVNETSQDVWFDNMMVMSVSSAIVQETHYDPWGLELTGIGYQYGGIKANKYLYNGKELIEDNGLQYYDYGARMYDPVIGRWGVVDPMASEREWVSPYNFVQNNPLKRIDPDGAFDWVINGDNEIYWDKNATSQTTTKAGDTYLGRDLTFSFNSYISSTFDGPNPPWGVEGDKLTSTISVTSNTDADNNLLSVDVSSSYAIGETGGLSMFKGRDYFPGLGNDQNKGINLSGANNFTATFEQHASVPGMEALGLNMLGYDVVNVAQKLTLGLSGNNLSVTGATDVFPSATLNVNGKQLFQYDQPSFRGTHGRDSRMYGEHMVITTPRRPAPQFYERFKK